MKAKAAVFTGYNQPFKIEEYELSVPQPGMAKIRLVASGICGTDIHIHGGKIPLEPPLIIGHEFVGQVEEIAPEDSLKYEIESGDNVIAVIACPCGECLLCREGDDANCINMGVTNGENPEIPPHFYGGYGEYNYSPVKNLVKIPQGLDPKMTCVFACAGPTALHSFGLAERANCKIEQSNVAVVQGLGPVGMFGIIYLAALGIPNIVAISGRRNEERESLARRLGATEVFALSETPSSEIISHIRSLNGGIGADLVFEASGNPQAVPQGMQMLRNRGLYLIPGQYSNSGSVEIEPQMITFNALQIIGSSQYSIVDVKRYLAFLQDNPQLHELISSLASSYKVEDINKAFEDTQTTGNIKTMLVP